MIKRKIGFHKYSMKKDFVQLLANIMPVIANVDNSK